MTAIMDNMHARWIAIKLEISVMKVQECLSQLKSLLTNILCLNHLVTEWSTVLIRSACCHGNQNAITFYAPS